MDRPHILLVAAVVLILLLAGRQYLRQRDLEARNDAAPLRIVQAEVAGKREFTLSSHYSRRHEEPPLEAMRYEATFRPLNGGAPVTLRLRAADYRRLDEGARGELHVRGTRFVGFVSRRE